MANTISSKRTGKNHHASNNNKSKNLANHFIIISFTPPARFRWLLWSKLRLVAMVRWLYDGSAQQAVAATVTNLQVLAIFPAFGKLPRFHTGSVQQFIYNNPNGIIKVLVINSWRGVAVDEQPSGVHSCDTFSFVHALLLYRVLFCPLSIPFHAQLCKGLPEPSPRRGRIVRWLYIRWIHTESYTAPIATCQIAGTAPPWSIRSFRAVLHHSSVHGYRPTPRAENLSYGYHY